MYPFLCVSCHDTLGSTRSIYRPDQRVGLYVRLADKATKRREQLRAAASPEVATKFAKVITKG